MRFLLFCFIANLLFLFSCKQETRNEVAKSSEQKTDSCCIKNTNSDETSLQSTITCPSCGFSKTEMMPTDVCQLKYTCTKCNTVLQPKEGDCCVFCTYGDHKCPSKQ